MTMENKINIWDLLRGRFPEREYVLMQEVRDAAGFYASRSADFIAVNTWPSRGMAIHGIEFKSFRGDWLREFKDPKKAEAIFRYCDYFWLLTENETIAKLEEIPETWGWISVKGSVIKTMKEAPKLTPEQFTKHFLVGMLKRAADRSQFVHVDSLEDRIKQSAERIAEGQKNDRDFRKKELEELAANVDKFEKASGISIGNTYSFKHWDKEKLGKAVRFVLDGGIENMEKRLLQLKQSANQVAKSISTSFDDLFTESEIIKLNNEDQ